MKAFISGGCKNGKSYYAQRLTRLLANGGPMYYVATMRSTGKEDDERIARHLKEREGWGFITIEQPVSIDEILLKSDPEGAFLLDSLTALMANEMFSDSGDVNENAADTVISGLLRVIHGVSNIVIVSDYIYSDAIIYDPLTELYRRSLAKADRAAAKHCGTVLESSFTGMTVHKCDAADFIKLEKIKEYGDDTDIRRSVSGKA